MYLILDSTKRIVDICAQPCYVRRQKNGIVVRCEKERADGIYSDNTDSFWPLEKVGYLCESHTLEEVDMVPEEVAVGYYFYHAGEFYTTEADLAALAKARAPEERTAALEQQAEAAENALCEQDAAMDQRMSAIEDAICELDAAIHQGGGETL